MLHTRNLSWGIERYGDTWCYITGTVSLQIIISLSTAGILSTGIQLGCIRQASGQQIFHKEASHEIDTSNIDKLPIIQAFSSVWLRCPLS